MNKFSEHKMAWNWNNHQIQDLSDNVSWPKFCSQSYHFSNSKLINILYWTDFGYTSFSCQDFIYGVRDGIKSQILFLYANFGTPLAMLVNPKSTGSSVILTIQSSCPSYSEYQLENLNLSAQILFPGSQTA